ncbi:hypothetical protein PRNP1_014031 [Phytophthora ramorum]|uniref:RxLR effector protein n=1 Tax=Phytophthora ramorum TaxID=164328 RepID=H3GYE5_PHYRM|nr:hypothetical protein KRP23_8359 [Phytophthora ramorum]
MRSSRRICWVLATTIAVAITSPIAIAQPTSYVRPGSEDAATTTAGVQPGSGFSVGEFVNEQVAETTAPEEDFHNTALLAADEDSVVGDVVTAGSYSSTTLTAATTAGESSGEGDTTTTTPLLFAMVAACVVVVGAIAIVTKRAEKRVPSPHTPVDKAIYFQVQVKKPGFFHVNRQLTPPMTGSTIV